MTPEVTEGETTHQPDLGLLIDGSFPRSTGLLSSQWEIGIVGDFCHVYLLSKRSVNMNEVFKTFPGKGGVKSIKVSEISTKRLKERKSGYEANWKNNLEYLIPEKMKTSFDQEWDASVATLEKAITP